MTAKEFYDQEKPNESGDYDFSNSWEWLFSKDEMILFADRFVDQKLQVFNQKIQELEEELNEARHQLQINDCY